LISTFDFFTARLPGLASSWKLSFSQGNHNVRVSFPSCAASGQDFQVLACCSKVIFFIIRSLYKSFVSGLGGFRAQISRF